MQSIKTLEGDRQMEIDSKLVRDLWAACRHMQERLHAINGQVWGIKYGMSKGIADSKTLSQYVGNIEEYTGYIYSGDEGFPDVVKTLMAAQDALKKSGDWKEWSDYLGFIKESDNKKMEVRQKETTE